MFKKKKSNKEYKLIDRVDISRMEALFKAILYNYDNTTNMKQYFTDINKYNLSDTEIKLLFFDKKMQKHPVVKKNKVAHELCKVYGFDEYYSGVKTLRSMMQDNLFDFEIKENLKGLIETFDKLEKLPLVRGVLRPETSIVKIEKASEDIEIFTDGEVLSDEKDDNGRTIIISKPTFLIRKFEGETYLMRHPAIVYGYKPNKNLIPTVKELIHSKEYKK